MEDDDSLHLEDTVQVEREIVQLALEFLVNERLRSDPATDGFKLEPVIVGRVL